MLKNINRCFVCGSSDLKKVNYLNYNSSSYMRNIGYFLPNMLVSILRYFSKSFSGFYHSIEINKKYFSDRKVNYCMSCLTGFVDPKFSESELDRYYYDFYWKNRVSHETSYNKLEITDDNLRLAKERIEWIEKNGCVYNSVIDFGAGDCSASLVFSKTLTPSSVCAVDKSNQTGLIAKSLDIKYYDSISAPPSADLIFSAHSIEHVHDLFLIMEQISKKINNEGYLFIEVPNIANFNTLNVMSHTPHTYMFSKKTFINLASIFSFELKSIEAVGPKWSVSYANLGSEYKHCADLRVLMRKKPCAI